MKKRIKQPRGAKAIFYRTYYLFKSGKVMRAAPGRSTFPGRVLKGWRDDQGFQKVELCHGDYRTQVRVQDLINRYFSQ